ncbi:hypothetical protein [Nocardiopsis ansamitocini]|uniref:Uncharacterized protein n=1 Tax=Nocardiopsis ansamitocini TaxID=1670832 RepID=A0A9W6UKL1_9ACTN|nr:hypothetical protein [Nocardiopsis ansamitocini]GLU49847.1 hypothetical protein Nans01_41980 [Nocardiopsis ansamitocini]
MSQHRPHVCRQVEETPQGTAAIYRLSCSCGLVGDVRYARRVAEQDKAAHLMDITVPLDQRCTRPREHGARPWDTCPLCAGQLALPGWDVA